MKFKKYLGILTTALVLLIFLAYFLLNKSKFRPLLDVNFLLLLVIAVGDLGGVFINGLFTKFILKPFKKHIPLLESFYVSLISTVGNFFAPIGAGFGFRAVYLKRRHGVSYKDYISTLSGNYIIVFLVNSFFGLLSLYLLRAHKADSQYGVLVAIFAGLFVVSLILSLVKIRISAGRGRGGKYVQVAFRNLSRVSEGWNHIISHRKLMLQLVLLTVFNFLLTSFITFTIIKSLHFQVSVAPLMLFSVLGFLSLFINITPANLGVKEAIYLFSSTVLGFSVSQILSIALIDRGVMFIVLAALWAISHKLKSPLPDMPVVDQRVS